MAKLWLGNKRGEATDWLTQRWDQITGRQMKFQGFPWLKGPHGVNSGIGTYYF